MAELLSDHPAKFNRGVLRLVEMHVRCEARRLNRQVHVLDPFAGVGRIHDLPKRIAKTVGVELEPEWASCRSGTRRGDATKLPPRWTGRFDVVATSPCYGNRMADSHEARDSCFECKGTGVVLGTTCGDAPWLCSSCGRADCVCGLLARQLREHNTSCATCAPARCRACSGNGLTRRHTYRHTLGRPLSENNAGAMQWGDAYREFHERVWIEARRVLGEGLLLANVKNHVRAGHVQHVVEWHAECIGRLGFDVEQVQEVEARGTRHGANADLRMPAEKLIVARLS